MQLGRAGVAVNAPERIWVNRNTEAPNMTQPPELWSNPESAEPYIRADIHEAEIARLREEVTGEAMVARMTEGIEDWKYAMPLVSSEDMARELLAIIRAALGDDA